MTVWMYYETDGDAGYYNIKLFSTQDKAIAYLKHTNYGKGYGEVQSIEIDSKQIMIEETLCPDCGKKMIPRNGQYGKFWGCSNYPLCKGTRDSMGRSKADKAAERQTEKSKEYEYEDIGPDSITDKNRFSFKKG